MSDGGGVFFSPKGVIHRFWSIFEDKGRKPFDNGAVDKGENKQ
jgi:hypothetical protein